MSQTANTSPPPMSALGLLGRLLTARGRNRADLCYEFMGTRNCPSTDCTYLNLGYWRGTNEYPKAAEAMVDLLADSARRIGIPTSEQESLGRAYMESVARLGLTP